MFRVAFVQLKTLLIQVQTPLFFALKGQASNYFFSSNFTEEKSLKKKTIAVKYDKASPSQNVVLDVILIGTRKRIPIGFSTIPLVVFLYKLFLFVYSICFYICLFFLFRNGDLDNYQLCYKIGKSAVSAVPPPVPQSKPSSKTGTMSPPPTIERLHSNIGRPLSKRWL